MKGEVVRSTEDYTLCRSTEHESDGSRGIKERLSRFRSDSLPAVGRGYRRRLGFGRGEGNQASEGEQEDGEDDVETDIDKEDDDDGWSREGLERTRVERTRECRPASGPISRRTGGW